MPNVPVMVSICHFFIDSNLQTKVLIVHDIHVSINNIGFDDVINDSTLNFILNLVHELHIKDYKFHIVYLHASHHLL